MEGNNNKKGLSDEVIIAIVNGVKEVIMGAIGKVFDYKCHELSSVEQKRLTE